MRNISNSNNSTFVGGDTIQWTAAPDGLGAGRFGETKFKYEAVAATAPALHTSKGVLQNSCRMLKNSGYGLVLYRNSSQSNYLLHYQMNINRFLFIIDPGFVFSLNWRISRQYYHISNDRCLYAITRLD